MSWESVTSGFGAVGSAVSSVGSVLRPAAQIMGAAAPLIATGAEATGQITAGIGGKQAADYNARIAEMQAEYGIQIASAQADRAKEVAGDESRRVLELGQEVIGAQRTGAAAGGIEVNTGSPALLVLDTIRRSHEDSRRALLAGEYRAWGLTTEAANRAWALRAEAAKSRWMGKTSLLGGFMRGASPLYQYARTQAPTNGGGRFNLNPTQQPWTASELEAAQAAGDIGVIG